MALSLTLAAIPLSIDFSTAGGVHGAAAFAKDGSGGGNSGGSGHSGGSSSGGGHGGGSSGHGGSQGTSGSSGGSGRHGNDDRGNRAENRAERNDDGVRNNHRASARGARVEVHGTHIEVTTADGYRQEIENGRFEMKDPSGRTVVERPATRADRIRLLRFRP